MDQVKNLIESTEVIEVILSSFVEAQNTSHNWKTIDGASNAMYKYLSTSRDLRDAVNVHDQRRIHVLTKRNRVTVNQVQVLPLRKNSNHFQARLGLTLVIVPCATNLCIAFTYQGLKRNHCFTGTNSIVIAIGDRTEFKLASGESWNDFATVLFC